LVNANQWLASTEASIFIRSPKEFVGKWIYLTNDGKRDNTFINAMAQHSNNGLYLGVGLTLVLGVGFVFKGLSNARAETKSEYKSVPSQFQDAVPSAGGNSSDLKQKPPNTSNAVVSPPPASPITDRRASQRPPITRATERPSFQERPRQREYTSPSSVDQIIEEANNGALSDAMIASLDNDTASLVKNGVYAKHGYIFKTSRLHNYFGAKSWYHPSESSDTRVYQSLSPRVQHIVDQLKR
jgi:hypothetical protein